jgi:hypothetical protein
MINKERLCSLGLNYIDEYQFDDIHRSWSIKPQIIWGSV